MHDPAPIESMLQLATRLAGDYLRASTDPAAPVLRPLPPEELARHLRLELPRRGRSLADLEQELEKVLAFSVRTGHPRFFNQLFGGHDAAGILGEWLTALLNTSMYTYESAPVATLMELALIDEMNAAVGFREGEGVFAPGGSISNLMAVLAARHQAFPAVKQKGLVALGDARPCLFLSDQAHYSLQRAAMVAGLGLEAAIGVASDAQGRMRPDALEQAVRRARDEGRTPFFVAATSGTTVPGAFDPIEPLTEVARAHGLWMHVDASYGGSVLLSRRHRHLMAGVEAVDSVTWNPHKMMGIPLACSATLLRQKGLLLATHSMGADYLFHDEGSAYDLGDLTLQCGRRVDSLKLWLSWQALGREGYEARVDRLFELAAAFRARIDERPGYVLVREPQGPNVCFRYLPPAVSEGLGPEERRILEGRATEDVRRELLRRGGFMVNYATLDGVPTFRIVMSNPATTPEDLDALLDEIEEVAARRVTPRGVRAS